MGSPISSTIAQVVLEELKNNAVSKLGYTLYFYKRYVGDYVLCIPKDKLLPKPTDLNSYHPNLQFTFEVEQYKSINFADLSLRCDLQGNIETNWFTKSVWSERYLNF